MKKLFLLVFCASTFSSLRAQQLLPQDNRPAEKFSDLANQYKSRLPEQGFHIQAADDESEEGIQNGYNRWLFHAKRHIDAQGNVTSAVRNINAWENYKNDHPTAAARKTSGADNWTFQGPTNSPYYASSLGRINVVAFDPTDSNIFYIGSAAGGTWKTTDGGITWTCLYSFLPSIGVADIKINPLNHNTIYVVTGDGDLADSYSAGVIVSHDGGATWANTSLIWTASLSQRSFTMLINPLDTNILLVGTSIGIYRSANSGTTWTLADSRICKQLVYHPTDTSIVFGTTMNSWYDWVSTDAQVIRSVNGGRHWDSVTAFTNVRRVALAVTPANPAVVKVLVSNTSGGLNGIYGSTDTGASFSPLYLNNISCTQNLLGWNFALPSSACTGQGGYDLCIAIDPLNANNVVIGGVYTWMSADGGLTWTICSEGTAGYPTVHPDKHFLGWHPLSHVLFETCDGGINKTYQPLSDGWINLTNGLGITEYYYCAVDNGVSFVVSGAQDNGSASVNGGIATFLTGGDGFHVAIDYTDPSNTFYTSAAYNEVYKTTDGGASFASISDVLGIAGGGVTPFVLHPQYPSNILLAYQNVFASSDYGTTWTPISPVFDASVYIENLAIAPGNPDYFYASYWDYNTSNYTTIEYSTNYGTTWNNVTFPGIYCYISDMKVDPTNEKLLWVTVGGSSAGVKVYTYNVATNVWTNQSGSLPNLPVSCIIIDTFSGTKYIGTETAVFYRTDSMTDWSLFNTGLPTVNVYDLGINYATGQIWAATFGRGMWKSQKNEVPTNVPVLSQSQAGITVAPNPAHGSCTITTGASGIAGQAAQVVLQTSDGKDALSTNATFDNTGRIRINTGSLPPGFYICQVSTARFVSRCKVVLN